MNRQPLPFLALGLALCGCTASMTHGAQSARLQALTPVELIASIDARRGQKVTVTGYFTSATDTQAIWENEAAHRNAQHLRKGSWEKCITVYPSIAKAKQFNGMHVRVTGKATVIGKTDLRSFWTCNPVALEDAVITLG